MKNISREQKETIALVKSINPIKGTWNTPPWPNWQMPWKLINYQLVGDLTISLYCYVIIGKFSHFKSNMCELQLL